MPKSSFFTGQPILTQLLSLIPRSLVNQLAQKHKTDYYCKTFKTYDHLVSMLFCGFHQCSSLRELITGLQANAHRLNHMGLVHTPRRSTLADANKRRTAVFFEELFHALYRFHYGTLPDSRIEGRLYDRLFVMDSTTITLFCDVLKGAGTYGLNGKKKGGIKAHVLTRIKDHVPCFVHLTSAATSDRTFMPMLDLPGGSIISMDKAYVNYKVMKSWTEKDITWVTRLTSTMRYEVQAENPITDHHRENGVISDTSVVLGNPETASRTPLQKARLIRYLDKEKNREFEFLCNNNQYSPLTIAQLYRRRWQIELLFKRIKQNFQFHNFLGDSENAIKIQMWCTLIADLLIQIIKDKVDKVRKRKWAFANVAGLIRQHLTTYIDLVRFLIDPDKAIIKLPKQPNGQLRVFVT
jgi:hypothetical protein